MNELLELLHAIDALGHPLGQEHLLPPLVCTITTVLGVVGVRAARRRRKEQRDRDRDAADGGEHP